MTVFKYISKKQYRTRSKYFAFSSVGRLVENYQKMCCGLVTVSRLIVISFKGCCFGKIGSHIQETTFSGTTYCLSIVLHKFRTVSYTREFLTCGSLL